VDTLDCIIVVVVVECVFVCVCVVRFVSNKLFALRMKFVRNEKPRFVCLENDRQIIKIPHRTTKNAHTKSLTALHIFK